MGWWKIQGTEHLLGDIPLDAIGGAVDRVVEEYQRSFGRKPTIAEWCHLLGAVMSSEDPQFACFADHVGPVDIAIVAAKGADQR